MYKLSQDDTGLWCTENGLSYGGIPLVAKAGKYFQPCQPEIDSLAGVGGYNPNEPRDDHGRWTSEGGDGLGDGVNSSDNTAPLPPSPTHPAGTQYADSGEIMNDASPAGPDAPAAPVKGRSKLKIDAAVSYLNANARSYAQGSKGKCAAKVEEALSAGGVDLPKPRALEDAKNKGSLLTEAGFVAVATNTSDDFSPQKGDVVIIQPYSDVKGKDSGHMAMFNGEEWVSDYYQEEGTDPYPGSHYDDTTPPYIIYRP